jgi:hypothetical protein
MKASYQTLAVGFGLVLLAWIGCFSNGMPAPFCPMPMITVIPALVLASPPSHLPYWLAIFVPAVLFFAWNPALFRGKSRVPKRSWLLLTALSILSIMYFVGTWKNGVAYQGRTYTIAVCAANFLWLAGLWDILYSSMRLYSFRANLSFHAALFAWLAWNAFPYLGELP